MIVEPAPRLSYQPLPLCCQPCSSAIFDARALQVGAASALLPAGVLGGFDASFLEEPVMLLAFVLLGRALEARAKVHAQLCVCVCVCVCVCGCAGVCAHMCTPRGKHVKWVHKCEKGRSKYGWEWLAGWLAGLRLCC